MWGNLYSGFHDTGRETVLVSWGGGGASRPQ